MNAIMPLNTALQRGQRHLSTAVTDSFTTAFIQYSSAAHTEVLATVPAEINSSGLAAMERSSETYIPALPHSPIHEHISADTRDDEGLGNYSHSQGLMSPASTPPPFLGPILSPVGRESSCSISSKTTSMAIEKPSEPLDSLQRKLVSIASTNRLREKKKRKSDARRPLNTATRRGQRQGSSEFSANAGDHGCPMPDTIIPMPDTIITKIEQADYAEDLMQSIRSRVLKVWDTRQPSVQVSLCVPCNVLGFMDKQFDGSNKSLGRVIVLSGTATRGQATTCSDYIYSNWPLRGPWLLNMLQDTFDGAGRNAEGNQPLSACCCS